MLRGPSLWWEVQTMTYFLQPQKPYKEGCFANLVVHRSHDAENSILDDPQVCDRGILISIVLMNSSLP